MCCCGYVISRRAAGLNLGFLLNCYQLLLKQGVGAAV